MTVFLNSTASADYVIQLKNGRSVETERYWEEKGELNSSIRGESLPFSKKNIVSIVKVEGKIIGKGWINRKNSPHPRGGSDRHEKGLGY